MYCSGCGHLLAQGQAVCTQCGRPAMPLVPPVPPVPGYEFQLADYAGKLRALSVVWAIWAALSLLLGVAGLTFAHAFLNDHLNHFGPWGHGPWNDSNPPAWLFPAILHFAWTAVLIRTILAMIVAWGLHERTQWGRIFAIVIAFLGLLKFPFGTALGIWTLVLLLGYRNATLYRQLEMRPHLAPRL